ncbi:nodulin-like protein [Trifolium medium]|uniref:Vacuolar iron transporter n=1 Tax=Trifolium medium TaxID=97028 RepID=A0A392MGH5_9FABA|nr:nodulin-like protein [Trifolium medium]
MAEIQHHFTLRAAVLGTIDGLLSTASFMMVVGAVTKDVKTMILTGIACHVAGALSMVIGALCCIGFRRRFAGGWLAMSLTFGLAKLENHGGMDLTTTNGRLIKSKRL